MNVHFMSAPVGFSAAINLMNAADSSSFETFVSSDTRQIHVHISMAETLASKSSGYVEPIYLAVLLNNILVATWYWVNIPLFRWGRSSSRSA